ncbi:MAG TPA: ArsB/NhaD family transporter [Baekduia sp.]|nr:ArsB/NhaD family transporter [Baekduia sp.]
MPALARRATTAPIVARAADPAFLAFVVGLGVIVAAASVQGLADGVRAVLPDGDALPSLLLIAAVAAVLANAINNIPATLVLVPVLAPGGPALVLAALIGLDVGPNLTYTGSLATLLWRRVLRHDRHDVAAATFVRVGAAVVPAAVAVATTALWVSDRLWG